MIIVVQVVVAAPKREQQASCRREAPACRRGASCKVQDIQAIPHELRSKLRQNCWSTICAGTSGSRASKRPPALVSPLNPVGQAGPQPTPKTPLQSVAEETPLAWSEMPTPDAARTAPACRRISSIPRATRTKPPAAAFVAPFWNHAAITTRRPPTAVITYFSSLVDYLTT